MTASSFIIFPGESQWRIAIVQPDNTQFVDIAIVAETTNSQIAKQVFEALSKSGYTGEPTILAIPSAWCFAASIATDDLPKSDRKAMLYRLEEKLPLPAEALIADFIERPPRPGSTHSDHALGVCVRIESVKPLVIELESAGVAVQSISPTVMLAVQSMESLAQANTSALLCGEPSDSQGRINFIAFDGSVPATWAVLPAGVDDLKLQLDLMSMEQEELHVESCDVKESLVTDLIDASSQFIAMRDESAPLSAAKFAAEVAAGKKRPWIEFRRGPLAVKDSLVLHRKSLNQVLTAAVILLFVGAGVMGFRAWRYSMSRANSEAKLTSAFHEKFPDWTVPSNVCAVVDSEYRKSQVNSGSGMPADARRSALLILNQVLENLPEKGRFTIDNLMVQETEFTITGRMKSIEDVDVITSAMRKAGMDVTLPQTHKESDKFYSFTLRGTLPVKNS